MKLNTNERLVFADGLRAVAAVWVVLYHLNEGHHISHLTQFLGPMVTKLVFENGNLGVPIFFVLSGFVMAVTTQSKKFGLVEAFMFMYRRVARLSPPYYFAIVISLLVILVKIALGDTSTHLPGFSALFTHIFYLQGFWGYPQVNVVFWTLCYEMQFYFLFSFIIYLMSQFAKDSLERFYIIVLVTMPALVWLLTIKSDSAVYTFTKTHLIFINYWYAFCAGALVGWASGQKSIHSVYLQLFCFLLVGIGFFNDDYFAITAGFTSLVIHIAIQYNQMSIWLNHHFFQFLGMISYSLYLIHNNVIGLSKRIFNVLFTGDVIFDLFFYY